MMLALAQFVFAKHHAPADSKEPVNERTTPPVAYTTPPAPPETSVAEPTKVFVTNMQPIPSQQDYEALVKRCSPPLFQPAPSKHKYLADQLVQYRYVPYVEHLTEEQVRYRELQPGDVVTYLRLPNTHDPYFWFVCVIATPYGNAYLSTVLNDEGYVPENTNGIFLTYDAEATRSVILSLVAEHPERFNLHTAVFSTMVENISELQFLLGDITHPHSVAKYLI